MKKQCPESSAADALFAKSSAACQALHKAAKKRLRAKARKEWWTKNGKKT